MKLKTTAITLVSSIALAASAQAGDDYSAKSSPEVAAPSCLWSWFAGGSAGYLTEFNEEMYTLHIGTERKCPGSGASDALFLEIGYTETDYPYSLRTRVAVSASNFDVEIIPITLNYKREQALTGSINWYAGAGVGVALVDLQVGSSSFDDTSLYAHIFAGLTYNVSEAFELSLGARYIIMDDPSLTGSTALDNQFSLDGDVLIELGGRINF